MAENFLFWKWISERTFIHKEAESMPGFKVFKGRISLFGGTMSQATNLNPLRSGTVRIPGSLSILVSTCCQFTYYRSNKKSWMTQLFFHDALQNRHVSEIKKYCLENNIFFKILLIVDKAPEHPPFIGHLHADIKMVFLPPNITSFIQPTNQ